MNRTTQIVEQQSFLTEQLTKMQLEMDQLANDNAPTQQDHHPTEECVSALVTGTFEFRPNTQIKERLTPQVIVKAMAELGSALSLLGVTLDYRLS